MTLIELQNVLGQGIEKIIQTENDEEEHKVAMANAEFVAKLAKQMINNADVCLRTDKLSNRHDRIDKIVGE